MTRETKVGLLMIVMLVGVFGFMVYKKMHRPAEALAEQNAEAVSPDDQPDASPFGSGLGSPEESTQSNSRIIPAAAAAPAMIPDDTNAVRVTQRDADPFAVEQQPKPRTAPKLPTSVPDDDAFFDASPKKAVTVQRREPAVTATPTTTEFDPFAASEKSSAPTKTQTVRDTAQSVAVDSGNDDPFEAPVQVQRPTSQPATPRPVAPSASESDPFDFPSQSTSTAEKTPTLAAPPRRPVSLPTEVIDSFPEPKSSAPAMKAPAFEPAAVESSPATTSSRSTQAPIDEDRFGGFRPTTTRTAAGHAYGPEADDPFGSPRRPAPTARIDEDFAPRTSSQPLIAGETYAIEPNDNFWTISRKKYGTGRYFMALAQHNSQIIPDPKRMKPGVTIATPAAEALERTYSQLIPKAAPIGPAQSADSSSSAEDETPEESGFFVSSDGSPMYRVGKEDTLSDISRLHLGRSSRWVQIFEMNRDVLADGNTLKIGTLLRLPADASRVDVVSTPRSFR